MKPLLAGLKDLAVSKNQVTPNHLHDSYSPFQLHQKGWTWPSTKNIKRQKAKLLFNSFKDIWFIKSCLLNNISDIIQDKSRVNLSTNQTFPVSFAQTNVPNIWQGIRWPTSALRCTKLRVMRSMCVYSVSSRRFFWSLSLFLVTSLSSSSSLWSCS